MQVHTRYVFEEVNYRATARFRCPVCGKHGRRQRTFGATVNPWNVNPDGTPRSAAEIRVGLRLKAEAWVAETERLGNAGQVHDHALTKAKR